MKTPSELRKMADYLEQNAADAMWSMYSRDPREFWSKFGDITQPHHRWVNQLSLGDMEDMAESLVASIRRRAELRNN